MEAATIIATISTVINQAIQLAPAIEKGYADVKPFAEAIYNSLIKGQTITQDQLDALEAHITELSDQLQLPLPQDS